jgi:hypothetical protein
VATKSPRRGQWLTPAQWRRCLHFSQGNARLRGAAGIGCGLVGAALLHVPAALYRIDQLTCATWPTRQSGFRYGAIYLLAVALLTTAWGIFPARSLRWTFGAGLTIHLAALFSLPFLSSDPLFYAALGRSLGRFGGAPNQPLDLALPPNDSFLAILPPAWRTGTSAYFSGFHLMAALVGRLTNNLSTAVRLYQLIAMSSIALSAALIAMSVAPEKRAQAVKWVLLCPLGIIEGTVSGHNDALLLPSVALFALFVRRRRRWSGLVALGMGFAIKASAAILFAFDAFAILFRRLRSHLYLAMLAALSVALVIAVAFTISLPSSLHHLSRLLGAGHDRYEYCTRSVECLPRVLLRAVAHQDRAARAVGLLFRALSAIWILYAARRAARSGELLAWAARALFIYYLYLHAWAQSWYLLPLLPLLPFADPIFRPAMATFCVTGVAYYALVLPYSCLSSDLTIAISDAVEAAITLFPPTAVLLKRLRAKEG